MFRLRVIKKFKFFVLFLVRLFNQNTHFYETKGTSGSHPRKPKQQQDS